MRVHYSAPHRSFKDPIIEVYDHKRMADNSDETKNKNHFQIFLLQLNAQTIKKHCLCVVYIYRPVFNRPSHHTWSPSKGLFFDMSYVCRMNI